MKVIDLFNRIANDELKDETKFKYCSSYFKYYKRTNQFNRYTDKTYSIVECFNDDLFGKDILDYLNNEIIIIEDTPKEDKKIEKIDISKFPKRNNSLKKTALKVNEIIKLLNNSVLFSEKEVGKFLDKVNGDFNE